MTTCWLSSSEYSGSNSGSNPIRLPCRRCSSRTGNGCCIRPDNHAGNPAGNSTDTGCGRHTTGNHMFRSDKRSNWSSSIVCGWCGRYGPPASPADNLRSLPVSKDRHRAGPYCNNGRFCKFAAAVWLSWLAASRCFSSPFRSLEPDLADC